ncbi:FadR/GntR family transcriptional regulator [Aneurinibacillus danicus]|uniref:GntR family transcriptional regulator n=1 Tax=Aneurinibacillus danicus TaxID=267746 RepID=A0A511VCH8_9BACL|nr:FadR/GntR family transcriptional regulator [Aneurinibacillus danicus]GEN36617.1 GntR family transcriptional regulator [Aneurinibacillus danicus]
MSLIKKSYQIVAEDLQKMIEEGMLKPGARIKTIDKLAEQYGVGKSTIREALSQLKARGLVESRQGEGTFVKSDATAALKKLSTLTVSNHQELTHLLQVRKIIETGCAEIAALAHDEKDEAMLREIVNNMALCGDNEEMSRIYDIQFHMAIARATKNPFLNNMMESISEVMNYTIRDSRNLWLYSKDGSASRLYQEHMEIFEAIRSRDPKKARRMLERHLTRVEKALEANLL